MAKDQPYYFSHDVNASTDPKIVAMMSEYGTISYAWWWLLIEKLAISEDYKLPFKKYTFIALDKELGMNTENERPLNENERPLNENERPLNENERNFFCSNKSFLFINSLISDFELLECDDKYFWSPSLVRRQEERKSKYEKKQEQRRLAGIKSGEARRKKEQNRTTVEQNEQKKRKEKNNDSYSYSYGDARENENSENVLTMFDENSNKHDPYKNVFKIYMNDVGEISSITKEKLEYLVNDFGEDEVITAISKASEVGKASIAYITAILNNKIREEAANGANKRSSGTRKAKTKADDTEIDWSKETADWL